MELLLSASEAPILSLCLEIHSNAFLIKLNLLAKHHEELLTHNELYCILNGVPEITQSLKVDNSFLPFSPGLSGAGRSRLHKDHVRSRETANRS